MRVFEFTQGIILGLAAVQPANYAILIQREFQGNNEDSNHWSQGLARDQQRIAFLSDAAFLAPARVLIYTAEFR